MPGRDQEPSFQLASGTTNERDYSYNLTTLGSIFYNTDTSNVEVYHEDPSNTLEWRDLVMNNKEQIDISGKLVVKDDVSFNAHLSAVDASFQNNVDISGEITSQGLDVNGNIKCNGNLLATQHSFLASHSYGGDYTLSQNATFIPNSIVFNYGTCYSATSGRFTAKIKGVYCFKFSAYTNQGNSTSRPGIIKNGSSYMFGGGTVYRSGNQIDSIVVLEINDWVEIQSITGGLYFYSGGTHNQFCGHLVAAL